MPPSRRQATDLVTLVFMVVLKLHLVMTRSPGPTYGQSCSSSSPATAAALPSEAMGKCRQLCSRIQVRQGTLRALLLSVPVQACSPPD